VGSSSYVIFKYQLFILVLATFYDTIYGDACQISQYSACDRQFDFLWDRRTILCPVAYFVHSGELRSECGDIMEIGESMEESGT
jgi:hypothetical protein